MLSSMSRSPPSDWPISGILASDWSEMSDALSAGHLREHCVCLSAPSQVNIRDRKILFSQWILLRVWDILSHFLLFDLMLVYLSWTHCGSSLLFAAKFAWKTWRANILWSATLSLTTSYVLLSSGKFLTIHNLQKLNLKDKPYDFNLVSLNRYECYP